MSVHSPETRFHSLDALRGFALLLGVFFHAAESFCPERWSWAIVDRHAHEVFALFQHTCHSFRMEIFFLIAGFFAHLLLTKRGLGGFLVNRLKRILLPLVVGWLVLYPIILFVWLTGASMSGNFDRLQVPKEVQHLAPWQLTVGIFAQGEVFGRAFNLTHLWFLHQLLVIYGVVLAARALLVRFADPRGRLSGFAAKAFRRTMGGGRLVIIYAVMTAPILWTMNSWGVDTPFESLIPHLPTTALYTLFFLMGWFLFGQPDLLSRWPRNGLSYVAGGLALSLVTWTFQTWTPWFLPPDLPLPVMKALYSGLYALMMWLFVVGITGLFLRYCAGSSPSWRYVADSSYWVYLVHLPVVVSLQLIVAQWDMHWLAKYPLILAVALPLLYASYHYGVRSTWVGVALNGRRYPRQWPWRARLASSPLAAIAVKNPPPSQPNP